MVPDELDDDTRWAEPEPLTDGRDPLSVLLGIARQLEEHGWTVVSEDMEFPIVMARRRLRWLGLRRRIVITYGYDAIAANRGSPSVPVIQGLGWYIRDERQLTG